MSKNKEPPVIDIKFFDQKKNLAKLSNLEDLKILAKAYDVPILRNSFTGSDGTQVTTYRVFVHGVCFQYSKSEKQ